MTNLVVIGKDNLYTFFSDRKKVIKVKTDEPMDLENLEYYRKYPGVLVKETMEEPILA